RPAASYKSEAPFGASDLALVERTVHLRDLLGLPALLRRVLLAEVGRAAEVDPEAGEVDAAAVRSDLLERREQRLALVRLAGNGVGRADVDRPVPLQARGRRD